MADNKLNTKRNEISRAFDTDPVDLKRRVIEGAVPSYFFEEYPKFIEFLEVYYDYLVSEDGLDGLIEDLVDIRNPDIAKGKFSDRLIKEYGPNFPATLSIDDATALKTFERFYKAKGSKAAIEAGFRIFFNTDATITFPRDNILRVSDGNWNSDLEEYTNGQGHLSETTMVIQDSVFYQAYSYVIRSALSINDYGDVFKKIGHPAGWIFFGRVEITELAQFEINDSSPTIVPGFQIKDAVRSILGAVLYNAYGQFAQSTSPYRLQPESKQNIKKTIASRGDSFGITLKDVNVNLLFSSRTVNSLSEFTIEQFFVENADKVPFGAQPAAIVEII